MPQYGHYVNLCAATGRRAGDLRQDFAGRRRIQGNIPSGGDTPIPLRFYGDVQNESIWQL